MRTSHNPQPMPPQIDIWDYDLAANFWRLKRDELLGIIFYNYTMNTSNHLEHERLLKSMLEKVLTKTTKILANNEIRGILHDFKKYPVVESEIIKLEIPNSLRDRIITSLIQIANVLRDINLTQRILGKAPITGVYSESLEVLGVKRMNEIRYWFPDYTQYTGKTNRNVADDYLSKRPKAYGVNEAISVVSNSMSTMNELNQLLANGRMIYSDNSLYHVIRNQFVYYSCYLILEHLKSLGLLPNGCESLASEVFHSFNVSGLSNRITYPVVYTLSGAITSRHYAFSAVRARYTNGKEAKGYTNFPQIELYYLYYLFKGINRPPQLQLKAFVDKSRTD